MQTLSVVIPAHNEADVIDRCLRRLDLDDATAEIDIIVVANGCTDDTADRARSHAGVTVVETETGSKAHALRLGDDAARYWPRIYLDADVEVDISTLEALGRVLEEDGVEAACPRLDVQLDNSDWAVRAYYDTWTVSYTHLTLPTTPYV